MRHAGQFDRFRVLVCRVRLQHGLSADHYCVCNRARAAKVLSNLLHPTPSERWFGTKPNATSTATLQVALIALKTNLLIRTLFY